MNPVDPKESLHDIMPVQNMYRNWFLGYASHVILERAVPAIEDGLKPVQRRILHAMREMDDGRYNKVANIIGQTMQYHPHGDASIGEALINLGQKELLIDMQGNWGDVRTGDGAAAARYIEARPSKFALAVLYNPDITVWQPSYDGRKKEPVTLPVKFPLLLAQGVEGIAVGLATKILPHNFCELIQASIDTLHGKKVHILPDFPTGGAVDCTAYNEGQRGGKVRIRASIETLDTRTLVIKDLPYGITTTTLIESIIKANDKGKIKVKKVIDNTAQDVEILVQLAPGQSPVVTTDALYAFTDCEVSVSPNACVILNERPVFLSVNTLLEHSTLHTKALLKQELEIQQARLLEQILSVSLEQIFIEQRIYYQIEACETWEALLDAIDQGLAPYKKDFYRPIIQEDLVCLTEIKIKRISKYDTVQAQARLHTLRERLSRVEYDLQHLTAYAIQYFKNLLKQYGVGRERKTALRNFDTIEAHAVAASNQKLYINRQEGFVGYAMKKDELLGECSDLDDVIVFRRDGKCLVTKVAEKVFVGKDIVHAAVFSKNDDRRVYNLIYVDGATGWAMVKRFQMLGITRDKVYDLTRGTPQSRVLYLTDNSNGEAEIVTVVLSDSIKVRRKALDFDFATLSIKGRTAQGNILTKNTVRKVRLKVPGKSTLGAVNIYYDSAAGRLNKAGRGTLLGKLQAQDRILAVFKDGHYTLTSFNLNQRYDPEQIILLEQFVSERPLTAVYYDGKAGQYFVKRFRVDTTTLGKKFGFIATTKGSYLVLVTTAITPQLSVTCCVSAQAPPQTLRYDLGVLEVQGRKTLGSRLTKYQVIRVEEIR
ncbi:MAG: DNA gyrase/topoisomerase IV subunit A [Amoebophilaceae bacterium]|jgi:topoisomerase-4 subunit A|nr:DNA gyrase/topoisomerase IV subunit A [Amoebophilaceae bacterium]